MCSLHNCSSLDIECEIFLKGIVPHPWEPPFVLFTQKLQPSVTMQVLRMLFTGGKNPKSSYAPSMGSFYDLGAVTNIDGKDTNLGEFKGKVSLVVNVASQ